MHKPSQRVSENESLKQDVQGFSPAEVSSVVVLGLISLGWVWLCDRLFGAIWRNSHTCWFKTAYMCSFSWQDKQTWRKLRFDTSPWPFFVILICIDIELIIRHQGWVMPSEVSRAHHHCCHGSHQIWTFPVVPLNAVVANHIGWSRVIYAIEIGRATSIKPPTCRESVSESSRKNIRIGWIQAHET